MFKKKPEPSASPAEAQIEKLMHSMRHMQDELENALQLLRHQVAQMASGKTVSADSIVNGRPYESIRSEELDAYRSKYPQALVLDVRTDQEWDQGHIDGAMHIDVGTLEERLQQLSDPQQKIIAICARGGRSAAACEILFRNGFMDLVNVEGGMNAYRGAVSTAKLAPTPIAGLPGDPTLLKQVADILDQQVRPMLKRDGGDIRLRGISSDLKVQLTMVGACGGCGVRSTTVNEGIKHALLSAIPQLQGVEEVS